MEITTIGIDLAKSDFHAPIARRYDVTGRQADRSSDGEKNYSERAGLIHKGASVTAIAEIFKL